MKRLFLLNIIIMLTSSLFCDVKLEKIIEYKNEQEGIYKRLYVNAQDDITGSDIFLMNLII